MRKGLKEINGSRLRFSATVERFGEKSSFKGAPIKTILLKDIQSLSSGNKVTDHLWFTKGKSWNKCKPGDTVEFDARVTTYEKGYKGYRDDIIDRPIETDYKLERPTKVIIK